MEQGARGELGGSQHSTRDRDHRALLLPRAKIEQLQHYLSARRRYLDSHTIQLYQPPLSPSIAHDTTLTPDSPSYHLSPGGYVPDPQPIHHTGPSPDLAPAKTLHPLPESGTHAAGITS
ncbi:uncharacterized protein LAJ45_10150 [Morchella importuna]|uniref:uncharacterized protein n=1 Tax=Morchella importuna TaxID=1174673 RepID=UPI001E8CCAD6|nr:uncharacterized protein LAJ45_10150 [Morchella importuna]KAH8145826.1 hypothetical protein LAJ45_10150 [Morchella importuna]